jgi:hypothetical protein
MKLLRCETVEGAGESRRRSSIRVYADALLFATERTSYGTPRWRAPGRIYGMSLIGPEQSIRAIAAGCSLEKFYERTELSFVGTSGRLNGRWSPRWHCEARMLTHGVMHMVALPAVSITKDVASDNGQVEHVIVPTHGDVEQAIYERLLIAYTTPLIPVGLPCQSDEEIAASERWRFVITSAIRSNTTWWQDLDSHEDQSDTTWGGAGLLKINEGELDKLVSTLVADRNLQIPEANKEAA